MEAMRFVVALLTDGVSAVGLGGGPVGSGFSRSTSSFSSVFIEGWGAFPGDGGGESSLTFLAGGSSPVTSDALRLARLGDVGSSFGDVD